ncbi:hypothetical protein KAW50_02650 [candidate division WOR-3 bacterium]|nr:hypothetical protein [candidate division WOR-3 bacterium]
MFIVTTANNKIYKEGSGGSDQASFTWDNIPHDVVIAQIQLTYPFRVQLKGKAGKAKKDFAPLLTIGRYHRYYFSNESTVQMLYQGSVPLQVGNTRLEAKIVGGIDDDKKIVVEVRLDKSGNCTINRFPLSLLEARIKQGTFREDIIRKGDM